MRVMQQMSNTDRIKELDAAIETAVIVKNECTKGPSTEWKDAIYDNAEQAIFMANMKKVWYIINKKDN